MVVLQDRHIHAQIIHAGDHQLGRSCQIAKAAGIPLEIVIFPVHGTLQLAVSANSEIDIGHIRDAITCRHQQRSICARPVARRLQPWVWNCTWCWMICN